MKRTRSTDSTMLFFAGRTMLRLPMLMVLMLMVLLHTAACDNTVLEDTPPPAEEVSGSVYVNATEGSDGDGDGSEENPFRSIQRGVDSVEPGDTVYVAPGSYIELVRSQRSGTEEEPIVILGPGVEGVSETAHIQNEESDEDNDRLVEIKHDYIHFVGFELSRADKLMWLEGASNVRVLDNYFHDAGGEILRIKRLSTNNEVAYNRFERAGVFSFSPDGPKNGEAVYIGTAPEQLEGNPPDESNNNHVHHNIFRTEAAAAVEMKEAAEGNFIEDNDVAGTLDPDGGQLESRGNRNIFRYNKAVDGDGAAIRFGGDTPDEGIENYAYGNVFRDHLGYGIKNMRSPQGPLCGNEMAANEDGTIRAETQDPEAACSFDTRAADYENAGPRATGIGQPGPAPEPAPEEDDGDDGDGDGDGDGGSNSESTTVASGNWGDESIWSDGVPGAETDAVIEHAVIYDATDGEAKSLTVNAPFEQSGTAETSLTVYGDITVGAGGSIEPEDRTTADFLAHTLTVYGDFAGDGLVDLRVGSNSGGTSAGVNVTFAGDEDSVVRLDGSAKTLPSGAEFNALTIDKEGDARIVLENNVELSNNSSTGPAKLTLARGLVQTNSYTLLVGSSSGSNFEGGGSEAYIIGSLGRGLNSSGESADPFFYPIGDEEAYRPVTVYTPPTGASGPYIAASVVTGDADTGSSTLEGGIDAVSSQRYYRFVYGDEGKGVTATVESVTLSYQEDDGVASGNTALRVATSADDRATWTNRGPASDGERAHTTETAGEIRSDDFTLVLGDGEAFFAALANAEGGPNLE